MARHPPLRQSDARRGGVAARAFFALRIPGCGAADAARATGIPERTCFRIAGGSPPRGPSAWELTSLCAWSRKRAAAQHGVWIDVTATVRDCARRERRARGAQREDG